MSNDLVNMIGASSFHARLQVLHLAVVPRGRILREHIIGQGARDHGGTKLAIVPHLYSRHGMEDLLLAVL